MAGSGALHTLYFVLLQRGYRDGRPVARLPARARHGAADVDVAAIALFAERPSALALAGGGIIVVAVLALARGRRADAGGEHGRAARIAVLTGVAIAATRCGTSRRSTRSALSPLVYYWGANIANRCC